MSRIKTEPQIYVHQRLMDGLNELMIAIKLHHHVKAEDKGIEEMKQRHPIPSGQELDKLQNEIEQILKKEFYGRQY